MSLLIGVPVLLPPSDEFVASLTHRPTFLVVNGSEEEWSRTGQTIGPYAYYPGRNLGVAESWNLIMERAQKWGFTYVALMSQGTVLHDGTEKLVEMIDRYADWRGLLTDGAWHCIVLSVRLWEFIGPFDPIFWPGWYEDNDWCRRLELAGMHTASNPIPKVGRELLDMDETFGASLTSGAVEPDSYETNRIRYIIKWGGMPGKEMYTIPYNNERKPDHVP